MIGRREMYARIFTSEGTKKHKQLWMALKVSLLNLNMV